MKKVILSGFLLSIAFVLSGQEKLKIEKAEDLPKHNYQLSETRLAVLIEDKDRLKTLTTEVEKDLTDDVRKYEFADKSILKDYYADLTVVAQLLGDYDKALKYLNETRKLADKESEQLIRSCEFEAYTLAKKGSPDASPEELQATIKSILSDKLEVLPFEIIQEAVESRKGRADIYSINMLMGYLNGELQEVVNNSKGYIPLNVAMNILGIRSSLEFYLPYTQVYSEVFTDLLNRKAVKVEKMDIWKDRNVSLNASDTYKPVIIGIWDTGVDVEVFPEANRWVNIKEKLDGIDNDKNGYVDDVHGVAYDYEGRKSIELLIPEAHNLENLNEMQEMEKGLIDVMANEDSELAQKLRKESSVMSPEEYEKFFETLSLLGMYNHGTHVAGIALEGNPFGKVLTARLMFDYKNIPDVPTMETAERWAQMYIDVLNYFKANGVRVVNMSWSVDLRIDILPALRKNGIGKDEEERFDIAKKMFAIHEKAFYSALEATPNILFVTSAGNSNNDVDFAGSVPSSFNFPNILTVGAVDIEGKKTSFTTEGESVDVYANGYEVESYIPGGDRVKFSGTSMSSPNVVNLAAKIMAINPKLTPVQVKTIIIENATASLEDPKVLLIHPANSIEAAKKLKK